VTVTSRHLLKSLLNPTPTARESRNNVEICSPSDRILSPDPDLVRMMAMSGEMKCVIDSVKFGMV
jgi:hypothetical protein